MMDGQNLVAEGRNCDVIQPICDGSEIGGAVDAKTSVELGSGVKEVVKRKRGRPPKAQAKTPVAKAPVVKPPASKKIKEDDEDVCFICFDGGSLVLCDHRNCPKAYHPACIRRDEEFFESAAKWNCGWHICSICQKTAHHMCYTCTYSLCRGCIRKADYVCVRGDKGFCTICKKTIMLIENNGQGEDGKVQADFDDKLSWEYLFKVYWVYLKGKLSLTLDELTKAKNPWKIDEQVNISNERVNTEVSTISEVGVHNIANVSCSVTSSSVGDLNEESESKRRKIDEQVNIPKERVKTENCEKTISASAEWASKELLDFVSHMKNGDSTVLSRFDVQALMLDYINKNNLHDSKNKDKIICDSRLQSLFKKPQVGRIQMLKLLERHFAIKEASRKRRVNRTVDPDWDKTVGKDKKRKNHNKIEECVVHNKLDEFGAVDVYNMNLIYLRRDLMSNLLEDIDNFHSKVVGSIVRIRISGCDLKHDMYRLVQVIGTRKVDVPYKVNNKSTDIILEVLNLDKKETISVDAISDLEFSEEECRRLQRSIRCGLVKHFTVGEIQEKAMALQSIKLNDWIEKEIWRLTHLRDITREKGPKKRYKEFVEKIQLLKTPDERERLLNKIPLVHSDPKMNPDYESDDTEEYFNKEHGDQMESQYLFKKSRSPKKRETKSRKDEKPVTKTIITSPNVEQLSTIKIEKDPLISTLEKSQHEVDCNDSTVTKLDPSSSVSNTAPETSPSYPNNTMWYYRDPNGKIQGPFSLLQIQRWSTSGYFPLDMKIWATHEDKNILLTDVLKQNLNDYENLTAANKVGNQTDCFNVCSEVPSSTVEVVNHEKLSDSQSFGQNWSGNNNDNNNNYNPPSVESTVHIDTSHTPILETEKNETEPTVPAVIDLPGPTPQKIESVLDSKVPVQDSRNNIINNNNNAASASSLVVGGGPNVAVFGNGLAGCGSTLVKHEEWDSGIVLETAVDHIATPTSNIDKNVGPSNQLMFDDSTTWQGMAEMIEFSTLAEESVSDLLAEVDAMESQYGLTSSPTSRRNSFVDDLFNDSFDEFSPTPDQGTRSDGFSSSGDIQLPPTVNVFDFMKTSNGLQQHSFIGPENGTGFKWLEMERVPQRMIDINTSVKVEGDEGENGNYNVVNNNLEESQQAKEMQAPKPIGIGAKLVTRVAQIKWLEGSINQRRVGGGSDKPEENGEFIPPPPPPPPPLTLGLDPYDPYDLGSETMQSPFSSLGRPGQVTDPGRSGNIGFDPNQQKYVGERYNSSYGPRERIHQVEEPGYSRTGGGGGGGYLRPPVKGQRVCRFYESGRCKKGATCKNLHP